MPFRWPQILNQLLDSQDPIHRPSSSGVTRNCEFCCRTICRRRRIIVRTSGTNTGQNFYCRNHFTLPIPRCRNHCTLFKMVNYPNYLRLIQMSRVWCIWLHQKKIMILIVQSQLSTATAWVKCSLCELAFWYLGILGLVSLQLSVES